MDWRLPNKALAQVWGRRKENVVPAAVDSRGGEGEMGLPAKGDER
jgi:hypothetical protein